MRRSAFGRAMAHPTSRASYLPPDGGLAMLQRFAGAPAPTTSPQKAACPVCPLCPLLRMGGNGQDRYFASAGAVTPEDSIRARRIVLGVCLKDLFRRAKRVLHRVIRVCLQARVPRIVQQESERLVNLFEQPLLL